MFDCGEHRAGFDLHCVRPIISIVGEIVPGRLCRVRCRGEIGWSGVIECEPGDWYRFIRSPLDNECERRKKVQIEWGSILTVCRYLVFRIEGSQDLGAERRESCVRPIGVGAFEILTRIPRRS